MYPEARPRIISDNGPQFIAGDFDELIRVSGMTPRQNYPPSTKESNVGPNRSKESASGPGRPLSLKDAWGLVEGYVEHHNDRLPQQRGGLHRTEEMLAAR